MDTKASQRIEKDPKQKKKARTKKRESLWPVDGSCGGEGDKQVKDCNLLPFDLIFQTGFPGSAP